jgi:hypothetical protein
MDWVVIASWAAGLVGLGFVATWSLFRTRAGMLWAQAVIAIAFGAHFALLGSWTAVAMNAIGLTQVLLAIPGAANRGLRIAYYALIPAIVALMALTWNGWSSFFAAIGMALIVIGRIQSDPDRLRIFCVLSIPAWTVHDAIIGSVPALCADAVGLAMGAWAIWRESRKSSDAVATA